MKALLAVLLVSSLALAGCGDKGGGTGSTGGSTTNPPLQAGKGAIAGLVINDVYRPVPDALVPLSNGLTATSDASGQFAFTNLEPGAYIVRVQADGHEAAPQSIDVVVGEYAEVELLARRVINEGSRIVTTEYSVFVPCAASVPASSFTVDCTGDQSGDSYRSGFTSNYTAGYSNITYLVTEMKASKPASPSSGAYKIVIREEGDGDYWASAFTADGDYIRVVMQLGAISEADTETGRNVPWNNTKTMETLLFPQGAFKSESQTALDAACAQDPTQESCFESRGLGPQVGVRAKFVQSLFLGEPEVDITTYCVLC